MWGKVFGGMAGLMTGGPLGALLGASFGHFFWDRQGVFRAFDPLGFFRIAEVSLRQLQAGTTDTALSAALLILSGHLARLSGWDPDRGQTALFRVLSLAPQDRETAIALFTRGYDMPELPLPLLRGLAVLLDNDPDRADALLAALGAFSASEGKPSAAVQETLDTIASALGRRPGTMPGGVGMGLHEAYSTLGVQDRDDDDTVRKAYRALLRTHHPDALTAQGASPADVAAAGVRMASINAAWDEIARHRGLRR